jgi:hypothetical protein
MKLFPGAAAKPCASVLIPASDVFVPRRNFAPARRAPRAWRLPRYAPRAAGAAARGLVPAYNALVPDRRSLAHGGTSCRYAMRERGNLLPP